MFFLQVSLFQHRFNLEADKVPQVTADGFFCLIFIFYVKSILRCVRVSSADKHYSLS